MAEDQRGGSAAEIYREIFRDGFEEYRQFINPLIAQRAAVAGEPIRAIRVADGQLWDADGQAIEDFHGTQALGHRNPAVTAALQEFLASDAPNWYPSRVNPFAGRLARRLCERTGYDNAFFGFSGADSIEAAVKLARALTRRPRVLGLTGAYHGCTYGALSLMQDGDLRDAFGPHLPGAERLPFGDVEALNAAFEADPPAAVIVEPIQGEGGVRALPPGYVAALCDLTARHGALLVADEVQTGMGRTGRGLLATENWPRRPDVVLLAKGIGGGVMPVSAMLTRRELFLQAYGRHFSAGESHNMTFSGNGLSAVAALAALDLVTDEVIARVREAGAGLKRDLVAAVGGSPLVEEVRGEGFMLGIKLRNVDHPWLSFAHFGLPDFAGRSVMSPVLCHRLYRRGFFCFTCGHDWSVFRMQPRYDIPPATLERFVGALQEEIRWLEGLA